MTKEKRNSVYTGRYPYVWRQGAQWVNLSLSSLT